MDANLEEVNKESKVWQHGLMNVLDWRRIFRNLGKLTNVRDWLLKLIGMRDPKTEAAVSRKKYDFKEEVLAWRIKLRKERYLLHSQDQHVSLGRSALDRNLANMDGILKDNRRKLLFEHFVEGASRSDVPITVLYTTEGERAQTENINNASKNEILQRTESQISLLSVGGSDGHTKAVLVQKLTELKRKQSSLKK
ncbi:uncharacterized protein [Montipora capricornis]|uniref:uncharacterized protein n=1 Tax=Montipora capricornis TaxID=246305 RepID=UPI0035F161B2